MKDMSMTEGNVVTVFISIGAALIAVTLVNAYAGSREDEGFRKGYIAGFAESKANLPSRHEYKAPNLQR